jgi:type IV pilus assembly protein PilV
MLRFQHGVSMLEVLIAIVLLAIGLLGVAQLQFRTQTAELEAYQRTQAIVLLQDMVDRINANRKNAADYVTAAPLGTAGAIDCTAPATLAQKDQCEWHAALLGRNETRGGAAGRHERCARLREQPGHHHAAADDRGGRLAGPVGDRGANATNCGQGAYGGDDRFRRAMVASVTIGCLQNNPATGVCVTP